MTAPTPHWNTVIVVMVMVLAIIGIYHLAHRH